MEIEGVKNDNHMSPSGEIINHDDSILGS